MTENCTSSNPSSPLSIKAAVDTIDCPTRTAKMIDEAGIFYILKWSQGYLDDKMGKLKVGYYREFTVEKQADDTYRLTTVKWVDQKDIPAWVGQRYKSQGHGGGKPPYVPKNEKPMVFESVFKTCADLVGPDDFKGKTYEEKLHVIWVRAKEISLEIIKESGA